MATFPIEIAALLEQGADPAPGVLTGKLYSKSFGGFTQLFYEDDNGASTCRKITSRPFGGMLSPMISRTVLSDNRL